MSALAARRFTSSLVPFVLTFLRAKGVETSRLEKKYPGAEISLPQLGALLEDAAKISKDLLFGLHAAQAMTRGSYGLLEFALRSAPTARKAMEQLATYGQLINPLVRWSMEVDGDEIALHHRAPRRGGVGRQGNVFTVARIVQIAREMLGEGVHPTQVWLAHEAARAEPEMVRFFGGAPISFGHASNAVWFDAKTLDAAPTDADAALNQALEVHGVAVLARCANDEDVYQRARGVVVEALPRGAVSLASTAKKLHVTPRTLQRRLAEDGVSFAELLNEARRSQAERLLRLGTAVNEVARQVGYADAAAFVRAFKSWTGNTPGRHKMLSRSDATE